MELTSRLQHFLNLQKITKLQIARELKLSEPTVHRWFKNHKPPIRAIKHLIDNYMLNPVWFFTGNGSEVISEKIIIDEKETIKIKEESLRLQGEIRALEKQAQGTNIEMIKILRSLAEGITEIWEKINVIDSDSQKVVEKMFQIYPQDVN